MLASPYLDYSSAYSHYAPAGLEQYPYAPSPSLSAGYLSYSFSPSNPAAALTAASPTPPAAIHPPLAALTSMPAAPQAFLHYPLHQPDRMQWAAPGGAGAAELMVQNSVTVWPVTSSGWDWITSKRVWCNQKGFLESTLIPVFLIVVIVNENVLLLLSSAYDLNVLHKKVRDWNETTGNLLDVYPWPSALRLETDLTPGEWMGKDSEKYVCLTWCCGCSFSKSTEMNAGYKPSWEPVPLRNAGPVTSSSRLPFCLWP